MKRIINFLRVLTRDKKTTAAGIASLGGVIIAAIARPEILAEPSAWVAILTAVGLLVAADSNGGGKSGPRPPAITVLKSGGRKVVGIRPRQEMRPCA